MSGLQGMAGLEAGGLERFFSDPEVSEILLNGGGRAFVERSGRLEPVAVDLDETGVRRVV